MFFFYNQSFRVPNHDLGTMPYMVKRQQFKDDPYLRQNLPNIYQEYHQEK